MNSRPDPTRKSRSHDVELPPNLAERVAAEGLVRRFELAVSPYRLRIARAPAGVRIGGDELAVTLAVEMLKGILEVFHETGQVDGSLINDTASAVVQNALRHEQSFRLTGLHHPLRPMSLSQVAFLNAILFSHQSLIMGIGPTGTGKTHLAIAAGLNLLAEARIKRIVITRPHVMMEGEIMTPALRAETERDDQLKSIEDVLYDLIGHDETKRLTEQDLLEITPLGRMRGRTFKESVIIVDEAQNMTVRKMRMAVTRIGLGSRMIVTGDPAQIDLRGDEPSGLTHLLGLVASADLAVVHYFERHQIVRNEVVARLEALYSQADADAMNTRAAA